MMTSDDGALIMKACLTSEREFYDALAEPSGGVKSGFERLKDWVPKYHGVLRGDGKDMCFDFRDITFRSVIILTPSFTPHSLIVSLPLD